MLTIERIDADNWGQMRRFIDLPFGLYRECPQWVPPLQADVTLALNQAKHSFYEHSAADFFLAVSEAFVNNWEYVPLTEREIKFVLDQLQLVANLKLLKFITYDDDVVGFALGFPDVSAALRRANGRLLPVDTFHLMRELRVAKRLSGNGAGILPEFQGLGGNALLYKAMEDTLRDFHFQWYELTQVAETAVQMRRDLATLGG